MPPEPRPGPNAFAAKAKFDEEALDRHRMMSNAFYQQESLRRNATPSNKDHPAFRNPQPDVTPLTFKTSLHCDDRASQVTTMSPFVNDSMESRRLRSPSPQHVTAPAEQEQLKLVPDDHEHTVPTVRGIIEERREQSVWEASGQAPKDDRTPVYIYSPKPSDNATFELFGTHKKSSNQKSIEGSGGPFSATAAAAAAAAQDQRPKSPSKKKFLDRLNFTGFGKSSISARDSLGGQLSQNLPMPTENIAPKAAALLGASISTSSSTSKSKLTAGLSRSDSKSKKDKLKEKELEQQEKEETGLKLLQYANVGTTCPPSDATFAGNDQVHDSHDLSGPAGYSTPANKKPGAGSSTGRRAVSQPQERSTTGPLSNEDVKDSATSALGRAQSLHYYDKLPPPTPPTKDTPPEVRLALKQQQMEQQAQKSHGNYEPQSQYHQRKHSSYDNAMPSHQHDYPSGPRHKRNQTVAEETPSKRRHMVHQDLHQSLQQQEAKPRDQPPHQETHFLQSLHDIARYDDSEMQTMLEHRETVLFADKGLSPTRGGGYAKKQLHPVFVEKVASMHSLHGAFELSNSKSNNGGGDNTPSPSKTVISIGRARSNTGGGDGQDDDANEHHIIASEGKGEGEEEYMPQSTQHRRHGIPNTDTDADSLSSTSSIMTLTPPRLSPRSERLREKRRKMMQEELARQDYAYSPSIYIDDWEDGICVGWNQGRGMKEKREKKQSARHSSPLITSSFPSLLSSSPPPPRPFSPLPSFEESKKKLEDHIRATRGEEPPIPRADNNNNNNNSNKSVSFSPRHTSYHYSVASGQFSISGNADDGDIDGGADRARQDEAGGHGGPADSLGQETLERMLNFRASLPVSTPNTGKARNIVDIAAAIAAANESKGSSQRVSGGAQRSVGPQRSAGTLGSGGGAARRDLTAIHPAHRQGFSIASGGNSWRFLTPGRRDASSGAATSTGEGGGGAPVNSGPSGGIHVHEERGEVPTVGECTDQDTSSVDSDEHMRDFRTLDRLFAMKPDLTPSGLRTRATAGGTDHAVADSPSTIGEGVQFSPFGASSAVPSPLQLQGTWDSSALTAPGTPITARACSPQHGSQGSADAALTGNNDRTGAEATEGHGLARDESSMTLDAGIGHGGSDLSLRERFISQSTAVSGNAQDTNEQLLHFVNDSMKRRDEDIGSIVAILGTLTAKMGKIEEICSTSGARLHRLECVALAQSAEISHALRRASATVHNGEKTINNAEATLAALTEEYSFLDDKVSRIVAKADAIDFQVQKLDFLDLEGMSVLAEKVKGVEGKVDIMLRSLSDGGTVQTSAKCADGAGEAGTTDAHLTGLEEEAVQQTDLVARLGVLEKKVRTGERNLSFGSRLAALEQKVNVEQEGSTRNTGANGLWPGSAVGSSSGSSGVFTPPFSGGSGSGSGSASVGVGGGLWSGRRF